MPKPTSFVCKLPFRSWIRQFFNSERTSKRRKSDTLNRRLSLEHLEDRLVPATIADGGANSAITITMDTANEVLTINLTSAGIYALSLSGSVWTGGVTSPATFTGTANGVLDVSAATVPSITITDAGAIAGTSVVFADSGTFAYDQSIVVSLTNAAAGSVRVGFNSHATFNAGLTSSSTGSASLAGLATVTGVNSNISLTSTGANISLGGTLTTTGAGTVALAGTIIRQGNNGTITDASAATFTINTNGGNLRLANAPNRIDGLVTIDATGAGPNFIDDLEWRNTSPNANFALGTNVSLTSGDINDLTMLQDNSPLAAGNPLNPAGTVAMPALPAISIGGNLDLRLGGPIIGGAALTIAFDANFQVFGNFGINLSSPTNDIGGVISLDNHGADASVFSAVVVNNFAGVQLGDVNVGHGALTIVANDVNGAIDQVSGSIIQQPGAGIATFTAGTTSGNISLDGFGNQITGDVVFNMAAASTAVQLTYFNDSPLASLQNVTLPVLTNDDFLRVDFGNAPVVLPGLIVDQVLASGEGIFQQNNTTIVSDNSCIFFANGFPIILDHANDFATVRVNNFGPHDVVVNDINGVNLGTSNVGSGRLTISAGGTITQGGKLVQQTLAGIAGAVNITSTTGDILLNGAFNTLGGIITMTGGPDSDVAFLSGNADTHLGNITVDGTGTLSVNSSGAMTQRPGTRIATGTGLATFYSGTKPMTLSSPTNDLGGPVFLHSGFGGGDVTFRNAGPIVLDNVSISGNLTFTAAGNISQAPSTNIRVPNGLATIDAGSGTIALTNSGDGFAEISGIAVNGLTTGSVAIAGASANINGDITVDNRLSALTVRDVTDSHIETFSFAASQPTSITGRVFQNVDIDLFNTLSALSLKQFDGGTITADHFGTIKTTSDALAGISGDFHGNLVNRTTTGTVLTSATVAGDLSGDWNLGGNVGSITAKSAGSSSSGSDFNLGQEANQDTPNGGLLRNVTSLNLGVAGGAPGGNDVNVHAFDNPLTTALEGRIGTITVKSWNNGTIRANSIGTITTTGDTSIGDVGDFAPFVEIFGNNGGTARVALGTLNVKGSFSGNIDVKDGNITSISAGRTLNSTITMTSRANTVSGGVTTQGSGNIGTISAGQIFGLLLDAKSIGTLKVVGNLAAHLVANAGNTTLILHGTGITGNALGTFSTVNFGTGSSGSILVENGGVGTITVTRTAQDSPVTVLNGGIGTISAGEWLNGDITAKSIGTLKTTGAAQTGASPAIVGNFNTSNIDTYLSNVTSPGTTASIGTLSIAGDLTGSVNFIRADRGIGSFTVKRQVSGSLIFATDSSATSGSVGRINTLTAGRIQQTTFVVNTLGAVKITGFTAPETGTFTPGDVDQSAFLVNGRSLAAPLVGVGSFSVARNFTNNSTLMVPFGITTMTVKGGIENGTIISDNPLAATFGRIGTLTSALIADSTIRAGSIGTLKTVKVAPSDRANLSFNDGNIQFSNLTVTAASGGAAIGTLSVASGFYNNGVNIPSRVNSFTVAEYVFGNGRDTAGNGAMGIGFSATSGGITTLSAANWDSSDLTTRNIGTFSVKGNAAQLIPGDVIGSLFTITGNASGTGNVGLGTFTATGTVLNSTYNIATGNVTSFTVGRFIGSDLLVGFHMPKAVDTTSAAGILLPDTVNWINGTTIFTLGSFKTTALFVSNPLTASATDIANSASFKDSNVIANRLGTVTISGSDGTPTGATLSFGIGFRGPNSNAGTVTVAGVLRTPGALNALAIQPPSGSVFNRNIGLQG